MFFLHKSKKKELKKRDEKCRPIFTNFSLLVVIPDQGQLPRD
jgi:hypothetical protein